MRKKSKSKGPSVAILRCKMAAAYKKATIYGKLHSQYLNKAQEYEYQLIKKLGND